jgi:hypothetical protein
MTVMVSYIFLVINLKGNDKERKYYRKCLCLTENEGLIKESGPIWQSYDCLSTKRLA